MITLFFPSEGKITQLYETSQKQLSYDEVGESQKDTMPDGYHHIEYYDVIGKGERYYVEVKERIKKWGILDHSWIKRHRSPEMIPGNIVVFTIQYFGLKFTVMDKIVDVIEKENEFKIAYGTLEEHLERGEELFHLSYDPQTNLVQFGVKSFSQIKTPLFRLGKPLINRLQKKFVLECILNLSQA